MYHFDSDEQIDLEMAYSVQPHMDNTCGAVHIEKDVYECGRMSGHRGRLHASGYGSNRVYWEVE